MSLTVAGVILCGGQSTRMGRRPKGLLRIGGRTFLDLIAAAVGNCTKEFLLVTRNPSIYRDWPHRIVEDIFQVHSPLSGIHSGLLHMHADFAFVGSCDAPFLHPGVVRALIDQADETTDIVVPASGAYYQPLCAVYSKACVGLIESQLSRGDRKVDHLFGKARVKTISYERLQTLDPELESFFNVNTPADLAYAVHILKDSVAG